MEPAYTHLPFITQYVLSFSVHATYNMLTASKSRALKSPVCVSLWTKQQQNKKKLEKINNKDMILAL